MVKKRIMRAVAKMRYGKLHPWKFGVAVGVICAIYALFVVLFAGRFPVNVGFLNEIYGWLGADKIPLLAVVYCFIDGFVGGAVVAWIYNKLL